MRKIMFCEDAVPIIKYMYFTETDPVRKEALKAATKCLETQVKQVIRDRNKRRAEAYARAKENAIKESDPVSV